MNDRYESLDLDNKLIWNMRDIGHTIRHISEGRGSQKRILILLREEGCITQCELTERLQIRSGSASEVIGKLEVAGLILRTPSGTDRRTANVTLTEAGKAAAEDAYAQRIERHNQMFVRLSEAEKRDLLHLLEKVNTGWEQKCGQEDAESISPNYRKGRGHHRHKRHKEE